MSIDFSTIVGILGVALTIAFFVVGYRQTIGARRERARSANTQLLALLLQRIVLGEEMELDRSRIDKLILGFAVEYRVRFSDIHSVSQLEALLLLKILENPYLSNDQRSHSIERILACFQSPNQNRRSDIQGVDYFERGVSQFPSRNAPEVSGWRTKAGLEGTLAAAAGAAAAVISGLSAIMIEFLAPGDFSEILPNNMDLSNLGVGIASGLMLITLTSISLYAFTRLREKTRDTSEEKSSKSVAVEFEEDLVEFVREVLKIEISRNSAADFAYYLGGKFLVEAKRDINRISRKSILSIVEKLEKACNNLNYDGAFIVSLENPKEKIRRIESSNVRILSVNEFIDHLRSSKTSNGVVSATNL